MLKRLGAVIWRRIFMKISTASNWLAFDISIDLIYALPGQTMDQVKDNVAKAISLDIPHMSLYSLFGESYGL